MRAIIILAIISISFFLPVLSVQADERILSFHSDITVHRDASMTVAETIRVRTEAREIKRGIYRDFPTRYRGRWGNDYTVSFDIIKVLRDGSIEPYHIEGIENGKRVYIGDKDVFIPSAEHTYTLTYRTDRQLGFFKEFDELYWNVTGNGWDFPIDEASATIELPEGASGKVIAMDGYTGPQGSKEKAFEKKVESSGKISFHTVRPLQEREGLTIAVSWPKGIVQEPDSAAKMRYMLHDNRAWIIGMVGLIVLILYYLLVWARFGKDPARGIIVTRYNPPADMSPAVMRFITQMGYDDRTFASSVINMAVKGFLTIKEEDGKYTLSRKEGGKVPLSPEEEKIRSKLLGFLAEFTLEEANHVEIKSAIDDFRNYLKLKYEKIYFVTNIGYFIFGYIFSSVMLVLSGYHEAADKGSLPLFASSCIFLPIWSVPAVFVLRRAVSVWKDMLRGRGTKLCTAVFMTIVSLVLTVFELAFLRILGDTTSDKMIGFAVVLIFINFIFYLLLKAPTIAGRKTLDEIEGFKVFLSATEKDRLNLLNLPERTPELFEKFLPYALALDVEQQWAEQFAGVISGATAEDTISKYPRSWYPGRSFTSSFGSALAAAVSSSSTAPGSSSGSGGGGSSGGGGGGGGGGGW